MMTFNNDQSYCVVKLDFDFSKIVSLSLLLNQCDGVSGDAFAAAGETELLGGGGLHGNAGNGDAEQGGEALAHGVDVRRKFGAFGANGDIYVAYTETVIGKQTYGAAQ